MLKEVISFDRVWSKLHGSSHSTRALNSFVHFLERRLGAEFVYDQARIGYESVDLANLFELAEVLRARGVIRSYRKNKNLTDEPRTAHWYAEYETNGQYKKSSGSSLNDDQLALTKTLAEAIERHVWFSYDQFPSLRLATVADIERDGDSLRPERFTSYSGSQREKNTRLTFKPDNQFLWVRGYSWTKERPSWVPAQIVSGHKKLQAFSSSSREPMIRASITTGLATHPQRTQALLSGALEVIERDAYIITWLNQLSPPRMDLTELALQSESLAQLLARCKQYRLIPHALQLPTDAPAYAICAVLEDATGASPRFSCGLKANRNPALAVEGAILEALRAHKGVRMQKMSPQNNPVPSTKVADIIQYDRLLYWSEDNRSDRLAFLIRGDIRPLEKKEWETDTTEEHFARIVEWCRKNEYELVSVSSTDAPANVPGWHIEFVVMPELQPLHYNEKIPCLGGKRLHDIPRQFGYTPREPYLDDPHPFA